MSMLSKLTPAQGGLVVSVPYKVAVWMASADDNVKSRLDDHIERKVQEKVFSRLSKSGSKMIFAAEVAQQILANKPAYQGWAMQAGEAAVLEDVAKAVALCQSQFPAGAVNQYRFAIWEVAMAVAQAHGEHIDPDNEMHVNRFFAWIGQLISPARLVKVPENISLREKTALKKLRAVLKE